MTKIYVLDTSVLIHDPDSLYAFEDNTVVICSNVVRELDKLKQGFRDSAYTARKVSRVLDTLITGHSVVDPIPLPNGGFLRFEMTDRHEATDDEIVSVGKKLDGVIVTNDTNLRLMAAFHNVPAEAFQTDYVDPAFLDTCDTYGKFKPTTRHVFGIRPDEGEQEMALGALTNPDIPLVVLLGEAGAGKTLLTLAAGLEGVLEQKYYDQIIITRETHETGEEIGFLPGTEEEKMSPWLQSVEDALDIIVREPEFTKQTGKNTLVKSKIKLRSLNFMRGRTFTRKMVVVDEVQNLTPKQIKMITTRMGQNSKLVLLGDITQIDNQYVNKNNCGLTYAATEFSTCPQAAYVRLRRTRRSPLASWAAAHL